MKIVLLSDGTGNGAAKWHKTNVWWLYSALDLHRDDQIAMYDDGVGSQEFLLFKILGGAFGWGLKRNVIQLYKFLCRNYEDGCDKVYLFGFSRGAFTVRVLAGLIDECGLIRNYQSEQELHKIARENYSIYREKYGGWQLASLFKRVARLCKFIANLISRKKGREHIRTVVGPKIEFIGVWDTVDAYGLPADELADLWHRVIYPIRFPNRRLSDLVLKACHAVSIDDERPTFHPVLWDETKECNRDRIEQVWFPGVHSDVGGGYPRNGLSLVSLDWMISKVEASPTNPSGLNFLPDLREQYQRRCDWHGMQHNSRAGLGAYYRYGPRNIKEFYGEVGVNAGGQTIVPRIHRSVFKRIQGKVMPYAPTGLPKDYQVVATRGETPAFESAAQKGARIAAMNRALNVIYWRRWIYRASLVTTFMLAASPFFLKWDVNALCVGPACLLSPVRALAEGLLPDFAVIWVTAWYQNPIWFVFLMMVLGLLWWINSRAAVSTLKRATEAWSFVKNAEEPSTSSRTTTCKLRAISAGAMGRAARNIWWSVVFGVLVLILIVVTTLVVDRVFFHVRDRAGWLCQPSSATSLVVGQAVIEFDTSEPCKPTGVAVVAGTTYRFGVEVSSTWKDGRLRANPNGLEDVEPLKMKFFRPLRRHVRRPWFELTGRVGRGEAFVIGAGTSYTPKSDGELYFYVNDAVSGLLSDKLWAFSYFWPCGENCGTASVTVTEVEQSSICDGPNRSEVCANQSSHSSLKAFLKSKMLKKCCEQQEPDPPPEGGGGGGGEKGKSDER